MLDFLAFKQAAAQGDSGQVYPAILFLLANEGQLTDRDTTAADELRPTVASEDIGLLRQFLGADFHNSEVGHVGPLLLSRERIRVQSIMQLAHAVGGMGHADENCGSYGDKGFDVTERDLKSLSLATDVFDSLQGREFTAAQPAGGKYGQMGGQMGQIGVQFLPEVLDKFPDSIPHIGHEGITGILHVNWKLYLRKWGAWVTTR
jgi:hypothetical protein